MSSLMKYVDGQQVFHLPRKRKNKIVSVCNKCSKRQVPNKEKSNDNWDVYTNNKCECGGTFELKLESDGCLEGK